ncbi:MAG TPA: hypothetical protein VND68_12765 [Chloroflexia bacterium]|jgi:hypothetical protein|nr:hypothetical protein [Chloroflexia bacterium]
MPDYFDDISTMEELDPEPQPRGRGYAREFVLGALLLLAVIGWASWLAWQQDVKQQAYQRAEREVTVQGWDSAYRFFVSASGYKDADARAEQIEKLIKERDEHYHAATRATADDRWVQALKELQEVRNIQPAYLDVVPMYATVETQVYSDALRGAVALRSAAEPPGLYYRTGSGWVWLEGSDRSSRVLGATYDSLAYDVPGPDRAPRATATPRPFNRQPTSGMPELEGRGLKVATLQGTGVKVRDSVLDPALYTLFLPARDGVLAGRYNERPGTYLQAVRSGYTGWWLDYDYVKDGRPISTTISMGSPDESIMDFSRPDQRYVVAVAGGASVRSSKIQLSIGERGEDGTYTRRPVYSHVGQLGGAQVSPDGRYMLLTAITPVDNGIREQQSALLFDLVAESPPVTLTTHTVPVDAIGSFVAFDTRVKGTFLSQGDYAGKLLLVERDDLHLSVSLIDPADPAARTVLAQAGGNNYLFYVTEKPGSSDLWLSGWSLEGTTPLEFEASKLLFIRLSPGAEARISYMPQVQTGYARTLGTYGDRLVYEQRTNTNEHSTVEVYGVHNRVLDQALGVEPTPVYSASTGLILSESGSAGYSSRNPSWYAGEGLFAYAEGGSLYAREYDGSNEVKLEGNVWQLIDPSGFFTTTYFR